MLTLEKELNARQIDPHVILDCHTGRQITYRPAQIGEQACIRSGTVIYSNVVIGSWLETGHNVVIRE